MPIKSTRYVLKIIVEFRDKTSMMGRFGGGWNWMLGIQIGGSSAIVNLLFFSIRFNWSKEKDKI